MNLLLWILSAICLIAGVITLVKGGIILGIVLVIVGLVLGPAGSSALSRRA